MPSVNVNGKSVFYTITPQSGEKSESPSSSIKTVLIHGLGSNSCFYHSILPEISRKSTCIAVDTPGSGLSTLGTAQQTVSSIVDDIIALLDALSIRCKVLMIGHSMGGIIASEIAGKYPERVQGVVLLGPVNPSQSITEVFDKRIVAVEKDGLEALANTIPPAATGKSASSLVHAFIRALILSTSAEGYLSLCRVIASAERPKYERIEVPLLILAGKEDKTAPLDACKEIFDAYGTTVSRKKLAVLPGVGHWHCIEAPEVVAHHIADLIGEYLKAS
ncbi:alpha beta hydrolase protein [Rutstroemia sp. NJR-2017a BBW]|nr:alpha beta hydrolase protein [Rutstroemia sp. NJR-2017a BBW]